jgi:hypothetical protein
MVVSASARLNVDSPDPLGDAERVRRAIRMAVRVLSERPDGEEVRRLLEQAQLLMAQTDGWGEKPPTPDVRDEVTRTVLSIHVNALRATRGR